MWMDSFFRYQILKKIEQVIVVPPGLGNGAKQVHPLLYLNSSIPGTLLQTANFRSWVCP
jgi:hypothetical protein